MDCWHCRQTAVGICRFCGRAICVQHAESRPYILQLVEHPNVRALVVEDALFCGVCTPRPDPVELPELGPHTRE